MKYSIPEINIDLKSIKKNYTFINKISQEILRLPNKKANFNLEYSFKKITLTTNYNHIGTRDDRNLETFEINELPSYGLLDFGILIPNFIKDSSLSFLITNILDKEYFEYFGYSTLGSNPKLLEIEKITGYNAQK